MKMTKILLILCLAALVALCSIMPSTFSWYERGGALYNDNFFYNEVIPVSFAAKSNAFTVTTEYYDTANSEYSSIGTALANRTIAKGITKKYKTTITANTNINAGVYAGLAVDNFPNDTSVVLGTIRPTINEKNFATRAEKTKKECGTVRIYFENRNLYDYWKREDSDTWDMWVYFKSKTKSCPIKDYTNDVGKMKKCGKQHKPNDSSSAYSIFYYDIPADTEEFFFYNNYYTENSSEGEYKNKAWNRTASFKKPDAGSIYYLYKNGSTIADNDQHKLCKKYTGVLKNDYVVSGGTQRQIGKNGRLTDFIEYYDTVRVAMNSRDASIGLELDKEYIANEIKYELYSGSGLTVGKIDGNISATSSGDKTVKTTITGVFGDIKEAFTTVKVPSTIEQVSLIDNVKIEPNSDPVEIYWYIRNDSQASVSFNDIILTF